jgi:hypothetical protein
MAERRLCKTLRLYHGTPRNRLACILKEGLKSQCAGAKKVEFKGVPTEKDLIWFTDSKALAEYHATGYTVDGKGAIIVADVEICNPLPWNGRVDGHDWLIDFNADRLPCDDYVKRTYAHNPDSEDRGFDVIDRIAIRCPEAKGMGEILRILGFDAFHETISQKKFQFEKELDTINNWAVTDKTPIKIVDAIPVKGE